MSIRVIKEWDARYMKSVFNVMAFGKVKPMQIGAAWLGKNVAMRAFKRAMTLEKRGT